MIALSVDAAREDHWQSLLVLSGVALAMALLASFAPLAAIGLIPVGLLLVWVLQSPDRIMALLLASPLYYYPLIKLGIPGLWKDGLLAVLIGMALVAWVRSPRSLATHRDLRWLLGFTIVFLGYLLFELSRSRDLLDALSGFRDYAEFLLVLPAILTLQSPRSARRGLGWLMAVTAGVCVYGGVEYFMGNLFAADLGSVSIDQFKVGRIYATLGYPTTLGTLLMMVMTFCFSLGFASGRQRWLHWGLAALCALTLVASFARGASLGAAAAVVSVLALMPGSLYRRMVTIGLFGIVIALAFASLPNLSALSSSINLNDVALQERFNLWNDLFYRLFQSSLMFGAGLGLITKTSLRDSGLIGDNFYLKILLELGVVGLAQIVVLHGYLALRMLRGVATLSGEARQMMVAGLALILGIAISAFSMDVGLIFPINLLYWTLLAGVMRFTHA